MLECIRESAPLRHHHSDALPCDTRTRPLCGRRTSGDDGSSSAAQEDGTGSLTAKRRSCIEYYGGMALLQCASILLGAATRHYHGAGMDALSSRQA